MKKFFSFFLAVVMTAALAVPAFASSADPAYSNKTEQSSTIQAVNRVPIIKVALPTINANPVVLNPYGLAFSVKLNGAEDATSVTATDQIASPVFKVTNGTNVALKVDATVTSTLAGNLTLATAALGNNAATETKNSAFIALHIAQSDAGNDNAVTMSEPIVLKSGAVTKKAVVTLPAADAEYNDDGTDTKDITPNYMLFQFKGDMAKAPNTPWTAKDTVKVVVAFTFKPDGTVASTSTNSGGTSTSTNSGGTGG